MIMVKNSNNAYLLIYQWNYSIINEESGGGQLVNVLAVHLKILDQIILATKFFGICYSWKDLNKKEATVGPLNNQFA